MLLVDTNVFLEILLAQEKKESCKRLLDDNAGNLTMTDFSLHSIGVILFRYGKEDAFQRFLEDIMPAFKLLSLPPDLYREAVNAKKSMHLDFDDAYQYSVAKHYGLRVATMDTDFRRATDIEVVLL